MMNLMKSEATSLKPSLTAMLKGRATLYSPALMASTVASAPSMATAFTVSFKEPRETYPIAPLLPAMVVIITEVLLVISASSVVLSTFSPASFLLSMPNSSMNAPLVPEPSSRETTVIGPSALPPAGSVVSVSVSAADCASVCTPVAAAVVSAGLLPPHAVRLAIVIPIANTIANVFFIIRSLLFSLFMNILCYVLCYRGFHVLHLSTTTAL